ncbi:hypothetical protein HOLleu_19791 [Holothuria leucospilota]|uniref:Uncharacterized protein n=1 Tax=Holothuria leucospilota TaxID=206669 RepID=A0A9Q1H7G7_HOLLE|nr:hypothetical protein HOLleu_19791 [Holothuria leucospilota]
MDRSTGSRGSAEFRRFLEGLRGHSDSDWLLVDETFDRQSTSSLQLSEASGDRRAPSRRSPTNSLGDLGWRVPEETQSPKRQNTDPFVEREPPGNPFTPGRGTLTGEMKENRILPMGPIDAPVNPSARGHQCDIKSEEACKSQTKPTGTDDNAHQCESYPKQSFHGISGIRPGLYDGKTSWEDYLAQFEMVAELHRWSGGVKAMCLAASLRGDAQAILADLAAEKRRNYTDLVDALSSRFGLRAKQSFEGFS